MEDLAIDSRIFLHDDLDLALQELDILFNTTNTELIGNPNFGTNFEQFLWQITPSSDQLRTYIYNKISTETIVLNKFDVNITVDIQLDNTNDKVYIVKIEIVDPSSNDKKTRVYQLK